MKRLILVGSLLLAACTHTPPAPADLAIRGVTVVDVTDSTLHRAQTVLVKGNRITAIGPTVKVPKSAESVDGAGRYLIPSLWDMHVHSVANVAVDKPTRIQLRNSRRSYGRSSPLSWRTSGC